MGTNVGFLKIALIAAVGIFASGCVADAQAHHGMGRQHKVIIHRGNPHRVVTNVYVRDSRPDVIYYGGKHYRWHNGCYYHRNRVVRPPMGIIVPGLPASFYRVRGIDKECYYGNGDYYYRVNGGYRVAAPPVGAIVNVLPAGYKRKRVHGVDYYLSRGIYYRALGNAPGGISFQVVGNF